MKRTIQHSFEFILVGGVVLSAVVGLSFIKDYSLRIALIAALTLFYVVVGLWHHHEEKNLHIKQVLEHFAIGLLLFVVLAAFYN